MNTSLDILRAFPAFAPYSAGNYEEKACLTITAINQLVPALRSLMQMRGGVCIQPSESTCLSKTEKDKSAASMLKAKFDKYGSDKSSSHDYHHIYGHILRENEAVTGICEIGLGSNNADVVSNMGTSGKPGASLRAFRDFCPNAMVYGADIDRRVLFDEARIVTSFVDQMDMNTVEDLSKSIPKLLDLVIDDGLHSPTANVNILNFGLGN